MFVINPTTGISEMFLVRPTGSIFFHDERCELSEDYLDDGKSILMPLNSDAWKSTNLSCMLLTLVSV